MIQSNKKGVEAQKQLQQYLQNQRSRKLYLKENKKKENMRTYLSNEDSGQKDRYGKLVKQ